MLVTDRMFRPPDVHHVGGAGLRGVSAKPLGNELYPGPRIGRWPAGCGGPVAAPGYHRARDRSWCRSPTACHRPPLTANTVCRPPVGGDEAEYPTPVGTAGGVRPQPARSMLGVAPGAVDHRDRPAVELVDEVRDIDGVAGPVDGEPEGAATHLGGPAWPEPHCPHEPAPPARHGPAGPTRPAALRTAAPDPQPAPIRAAAASGAIGPGTAATDPDATVPPITARQAATQFVTASTAANREPGGLRESQVQRFPALRVSVRPDALAPPIADL